MPFVVCSACHRQLRPVRLGIEVIERKEDGTTPYKLWAADLYECPTCGRRAITGFAQRPLAQEGQPGFSQKVVKAELAGAYDFI